MVTVEFRMGCESPKTSKHSSLLLISFILPASPLWHSFTNYIGDSWKSGMVRHLWQLFNCQFNSMKTAPHIKQLPHLYQDCLQDLLALNIYLCNKAREITDNVLAVAFEIPLFNSYTSCLINWPNPLKFRKTTEKKKMDYKRLDYQQQLLEGSLPCRSQRKTMQAKARDNSVDSACISLGILPMYQSLQTAKDCHSKAGFKSPC